MGRHKEWRKLAKKMRRKRIRRLKAVERDKEIKESEENRAQSPSFKQWQEEQQLLEKFRQEEEERVRQEQHNRWLHEEELAKKRWEKQQERLKRIKAEAAKQELIIREEWQREQDRLERAAEEKLRVKEQMEREQAKLLDQIEKYVLGESDRLPSSVKSSAETRPGETECPFFRKVAACRFRDSCSRNHVKPNVSKTLLLQGFYTHFRMEHVNQTNEYDTDLGLEFDECEIYQHFLEFYHDVLTELQSYGKVVQFKVCCNQEPHLRGNVYVQYSSERYAIKALRALQGRFYGGKQVSVEFCNIPSWKGALCGLFHRNKCPKGNLCNFLHVFRNPRKAFCKADFDIFDDPLPKKDRETPEDWRWSVSPEPSSARLQEVEVNVPRRQSDSKRENEHHDRKSTKRHRSRSRSRSRSSRRSRSKNRSRSRSRSKAVKKKKRK